MVQPDMRAFNHQTIFAKVAAMFCTMLGNHGFDPGITQWPPMPLRVVAAISVDLGALQGMAAQSANR